MSNNVSSLYGTYTKVSSHGGTEMVVTQDVRCEVVLQVFTLPQGKVPCSKVLCTMLICVGLQYFMTKLPILLSHLT